MRVFVWIIASAIFLGCTENREDCLLKGCERVLSASETTLGNCWTYGYDARHVKNCVHDYVMRTPIKEIEMPFLCYAALKFEPERFPNNRKGEDPKFLFQWGGVMEARDQSLEFSLGPNLCFTVFMLTSNDVTRVLSFDLRRNRYNRNGYGSDFYDYVRGMTWLSIWDGHLSDLNRPEEIFAEQYKDVFAVVSDQQFNYDCSPWATNFQVAREVAGRKRIFRMVWRTKECMLFLPEVLFNDANWVSQK